MPPITLDMSTRPAATSGFGGTNGTINSPTNLRILTTGAEGETLLNAGPPHGRKWTYFVQVNIVEEDQ